MSPKGEAKSFQNGLLITRLIKGSTLMRAMSQKHLSSRHLSPSEALLLNHPFRKRGESLNSSMSGQRLEASLNVEFYFLFYLFVMNILGNMYKYKHELNT